MIDTTATSQHQIAPPHVLTGENPFAVPPEADLLTTPVHEEPRWNETMFFVIWSPSQEVGVWLHMGVVPEDKTMWWAQVYALLPEGKVLVDRSFGRTTDNRGPDTGNLKVRCLEPLKRWAISFDGAGEITDTAKLAAGLGGAGVAAPFQFEVELDAVAPVYDMHAAASAELRWVVGHVHHEQTLTTRGWLRSGDKEWSLDDAVTVRDHSVGQRDFKDFNGWVWSHAYFPESGRSLAGCVMWRGVGNSWISCVAMIHDAGTTEVFGDFRMTGLDAYGGHPDELEMRFVRVDGTHERVTGNVVHNVTMTYAEPNHNLNGALLDPPEGMENPLIADESVMRWDWNGEIGYGHVERAFRPNDLPGSTILTVPGSQLSPAAT